MTTPLKPIHLKCEHRSDPLGVDNLRPHLSWALEGEGRSRRQAEYRILVSNQCGSLSDCQGDLWDSGRISADQSLDIAYAGQPLASAERAWWRVCVWDENGRPEWSDTAFWEMGLLEPTDWEASWLTAPLVSENGASAPGREAVKEERSWLRTSIGSSPVQYLRREFDIDRPVRRARVYASARGLYRLSINGEAADDRVFAPGWTDYHQRIEYQTYDITDRLYQGANAIGVMLAEGWYAGYVGFTPRRNGAHYGTRPSFLGQIVLDFEGGGQQVIGTDERWRISLGPVEYSDMLMGERYDARRELVHCHAYIVGFRATQMFQGKAQFAGNGMSFSRTATPYWSIWVAPFGRAVKQSSAVLHLLVRARHYRRRRALRSTASRPAEPHNISVTVH